jgi:NADPH2:quinone reductase
MLMHTSKTLTGRDLWSYLTSKEERINRANQLFVWIKEGKIKVAPFTTFRLSEGKQAHDFLESGQSAGKVLLIP